LPISIGLAARVFRRLNSPLNEVNAFSEVALLNDRLPRPVAEQRKGFQEISAGVQLPIIEFLWIFPLHAEAKSSSASTNQAVGTDVLLETDQFEVSVVLTLPETLGNFDVWVTDGRRLTEMIGNSQAC
jgi:hypothetical protein